MSVGVRRRLRGSRSGLMSSVPFHYGTSRSLFLLVLLACFAWEGCQLSSQTSGQHPQLGTPMPCDQIEARIDLRDRIETLRDLAHAFYNGCHETVMTYGTKAQTEYRYKTFSLLKEASNIFFAGWDVHRLCA